MSDQPYISDNNTFPAVIRLPPDYTIDDILMALSLAEVIAIGGIDNKRETIIFYCNGNNMSYYGDHRPHISHVLNERQCENWLYSEESIDPNHYDVSNSEGCGAWTMHNIPLSIQLFALSRLTDSPVDEMLWRILKSSRTNTTQ